jgi:glycosyltransferase involved in cell wall biosynthesis
MRVRILEAFAYAMPVVTTTIGLEGIQAELEKDVIVADKADDFASRVVELLENPSLQEKLSVHGRALAETRYDWQAALSAMKKIYEA